MKRINLSYVFGGVIILATLFLLFMLITGRVVGGNPPAIVGEDNQSKKINNFTECIEAGNPVMESYPRQCRTKEGESFVEQVPEIKPDYSNVNFTETGYVVNEKRTNPNANLEFIYDLPGNPTATTTLEITEKSFCNLNSEKSIPCVLLSSIIANDIGDRRVDIKGIKREGGVELVEISFSSNE